VSLALAHGRALTVELLRHPSYLVPTLAFPTLFFLFFAVPAGGGDAGANVRLATFAGFAAIGVAFFQFGVGIAVERTSPWETYLRTLPLSVRARMVARVISAALFAAAAASLVVFTAAAATPASLPPARWLELAAALLAGIVPFALLGIALGYWAPPRGALPLANLLYLSLSYAGGLWLRPDRLPAGVRAVSPLLPTRALAEALTAPALGGPAPWRSWLALSLFAAVFAVFAAWGYRRDEGRRFR
jgi:ABC-2 type transport system permease protein